MYTFKRGFVAASIAITIVLFISIYIWKVFSVRSVEKRFSVQEYKLKRQVDSLLVKRDKYFLKLLATPYVWTVRNELIKGNVRAVNVYNKEILREKRFVSVMVINVNGTIISSTDNKLEGENFLTISSAYYLNVDSTVVTKLSDSLYFMASPIIGAHGKLGTLIVKYASKTPEMFR